MENQNKTWTEVTNTGGLDASITDIQDYKIQWSKNHREAKQFLERIKKPYLRSGEIKELHKKLFNGITDFGGQTSRTQLSFGQYQGAPPSTMDAELRLMDKQMDQLWQKASNDDDRLKAIAFQHGRLVSIHAFADGNGRTSRMALNHSTTRAFDKPLNNKIERSEYIAANNSAISHDNVGRLASLIATDIKMDYRGHEQELSDYRVANFPVEHDLDRDGLEMTQKDRGVDGTQHHWLKSYDTDDFLQESNAKPTKIYDEQLQIFQDNLAKPLSVANTAQAVKDFRDSGAMKKKFFSEKNDTAFTEILQKRLAVAVNFSTPEQQEMFKEKIEEYMIGGIDKAALEKSLKSSGWEKPMPERKGQAQRKGLRERASESVNKSQTKGFVR